MRAYEYLQEKDGKYILKNQTLLYAFSAIFFFGFGASVLYRYGLDNKIILLASLFFGLGALTIFRMSTKHVFDPTSRTITFGGLRETVYSFNSFLRFEMIKAKHGFITVGNHLHLVFDVNGEEKSHLLRAYGPILPKKSAQQLYDEVSSVMGVTNDGNRD